MILSSEYLILDKNIRFRQKYLVSGKNIPQHML